MSMMPGSLSFELLKVEFHIVLRLEWSSANRITIAINFNAVYVEFFGKCKGFTRLTPRGFVCYQSFCKPWNGLPVEYIFISLWK